MKRGPVDRLQRWVNAQATAGGDLRFWLFAGGYTLILFLLCVAFALGLVWLFETYGGGVS